MNAKHPKSSMDEKPAASADDAAIIAEAKGRIERSASADAEYRREALDDIRFLAGDQWSDSVRQQRELEGRPCLTINKLPTSVRQVTNSNRRNVPSILVHPATNDEAARKRADVLQGAIRHVEYASQASVAYDTAVDAAATHGRGYFRLLTRYVDEDSFDQELAFDRSRNALSHYPDPADVTMDGSGSTWHIISAMMARADFKAQYPQADPCDFEGPAGVGDHHRTPWVNESEVRVAEYYRIVYTPETVVLLSNGESGFESDLESLPAGVTVVKTRKSNRRKVEWFKLSALEVLERAEIPCKWIPVFPVYGDELDVDGKVIRSGMVRHAKDPARFYNYWVTSATEEIALRTKTPWIGAEGQFEGHEDKWARSNTQNLPYLEYRPKALGGVLAPPPQRQPMADVPVGMLQMASMASDDLKATTGIFDASMGNRSNETSGRAIMARDKQGETANSHFIDNLHTTLRHVGRCILDMWPKVYDGTRTLSLMGEDGKVTTAEVNAVERKVDGYGQVVEEILNDMNTAEMSVTVRAGPSYDTMRQEAVEGMIQTAQSWPKLMEVAGDKVIRSMDWPMADQIADRIEKTIPPELRDKPEGQDDGMIDTPQGPVPRDQVGPMLAQMKQQMDEMGAALQESQAGLDKARIAAETQIKVAEINNAGKQDVEELKGYVQLLLAQQQQAEAAIAGMQQSALGRQDEPGSEPPSGVRADKISALLEALVGAQTAPKAPSRKRMRIMAPSGAVYEGEVEDAVDEAAPEPVAEATQPMPEEGAL